MIEEVPISQTWFLRTSPESVHGELPLATLRQWAEGGRLMADNELSPDGKVWSRACELAALKMDWTVTLKSGANHGPLNLLAIPSLYRRGIIDDEAVLENKSTHQRIPAASLLRGLAPAPVADDKPPTAATSPVPTSDPTKSDANAVKSAAKVVATRVLTRTPGAPLVDSTSMGDAVISKPSGSADGVAPLLTRLPAVPPPASPAPSAPARPVVTAPIVQAGPPSVKVSVAKASSGAGGSILETIQHLEAKAEEAVALSVEVERLTRDNAELKAFLDQIQNQSRTGGADDQQLHFRSEIAQLRDQVHAASVRADAAEEACAERSEALERAEEELRLLRSATRGASSVSTLLAQHMAPMQQALEAIDQQYAACGRGLRSRLDAAQNDVQSLGLLLSAVIGDAAHFDGLLGELATLGGDVESSHAQDRAQWMAVNQIAEQESEDNLKSQQAEASLRQRIALLEAALAEYKNREAKAAAKPKVPAVTIRETDKTETRIADIETQAAKRIEAVRTELQNVISALRNENKALVERLSVARHEPMPPVADAADKDALKAAQEELRKMHGEAIEKMTKKHSAEVAELNSQLMDAKRTAELAVAVGGETSVSALKRQNVDLSQRDAEQSQSIAELKSQVASLYGEMALRQREALERFKQRESELKVEMQSLATGQQPVATPKPIPAAADNGVVKALRDEIAQLRAERDAAKRSADESARQDQAARDEIKHLRRAEAEWVKLKTVAAELGQARKAETELSAKLQAAQLSSSRESAELKRALEEQASALAQARQAEAKLQAAQLSSSRESAELKLALEEQASALEQARQAEAILKAELEASKSTGDTDTELAAILEKQAKAFEDANKSWAEREKALLAETEELKNAVAQKEAETAMALESAKEVVPLVALRESSERVSALEEDLKTLRAENEKLRAAATEAQAVGGPESPVSLSTWYLRMDNGKVFGPVSLTELIEWAADCRIGPDHQVSPDSKNWKRASEVPELRMNWIVRLEDGQTFGPLNLFAIGQLIQDGAVNIDTTVDHAVTGEKQSFSTVIASEIKSLLEREKQLVTALQVKEAAKRPEKRKRLAY